MAPVSAAPRRDPLAADRRLPRRPADDPHVRRDAAARDRRRALAHRRPLGALGRRLGSRLPRHDLGRHRRDHRRAALPRHHELERGFRDPRRTGTGRSPSGRAASGSGARSPSASSSARWIVRRSGASVRALHGRRRAGPPARAGDRPLGQLVEPGALRQAHDAAVGPRDPRQGRREHVPPDVPLRVPLGRPRRRAPALDRPPLHAPAARALLALRRAVHGLPHLRGDAADRPVEPLPRAADQLLGLARRASSRASRSSSGGSSCARRRRRTRRRRSRASRARCRKGPTMAVPRGRVR